MGEPALRVFCIWLPKRNSSRHRRRPGWAKPEVWFRIVHFAQEGADRGPVAAYREQTVVIALGPKGAFQEDNLTALTRWVAPEQVVTAAPVPRGTPKRPREPRTPRIVELLRQAGEWQALLASGEVANQAAIARREGITRARVTQVMGLLRLAPEIQRHIMSLPAAIPRSSITERALRPVAQIEDHGEQVSLFETLIS